MKTASCYFYISFRPDLSHSRPYSAVQCGVGMLHRYLSGLRGFATLEDAMKWSRKFEKESGYLLVSRSTLPQWFTDDSAVDLPARGDCVISGQTP